MTYPFPEDDEMDPQEELNTIDREMGMMAERRHQVIRDIKKRALDPATAKIAELADAAGYNRGIREGLEKRIKFLEMRIEVRDVRLNNQSDYSQIKNDLDAAELKLKRRRRR